MSTPDVNPAEPTARGNGLFAGGESPTSRASVDETLPGPRVAQIAGAIGLALWFLTFVIGLLVSSQAYREALLPPPSPGSPPIMTDLGRLPAWSSVIVVLKAAFTFSPINIGLLCVTAGLVGGCAANLSWYKLASQEATNRVSARRSAYLTEHPANAVMRSFLIYLLLMAGLLAFMPDPFKLMELSATAVGEAAFRRDLLAQQAAYTRMASLASVLSFMVGYDPSRFDGLFELVPRLGNGNGAQKDPPQGGETPTRH